MTVDELIEKLRSYPGDTKVYVEYAWPATLSVDTVDDDGRYKYVTVMDSYDEA